MAMSVTRVPTALTQTPVAWSWHFLLSSPRRQKSAGGMQVKTMATTCAKHQPPMATMATRYVLRIARMWLKMR